MHITLDASLAKSTKRVHLPLENLGAIVEQKLDCSDGYELVASTIGRRVETLQQGFLSCVSRAYSDHEKLQIAPHDIWFLILSEIAIVIHSNHEVRKRLLTRTASSLDLCVRVDDLSDIDLDDVAAMMKDIIPVDFGLFFPEVSTHSPQSRVAMYAAMGSGVRANYTYSKFDCGIPEIRLAGTEQDWSQLVRCATGILDSFSATGVVEPLNYLRRVVVTLEKIRACWSTPDQDFWKAIFTSRNEGSGGELIIDGWITDLFYEKRDRPSLQSFMATASVVQLYCRKSDQHYTVVFGAFERHRTADDFIYSEYASLTFRACEKSDESVVDSTVSKMVNDLLSNPIRVD